VIQKLSEGLGLTTCHNVKKKNSGFKFFDFSRKKMFQGNISQLPFLGTFVLPFDILLSQLKSLCIYPFVEV
jgi:hypothetical protein